LHTRNFFVVVIAQKSFQKAKQIFSTPFKRFGRNYNKLQLTLQLFDLAKISAVAILPNKNYNACALYEIVGGIFL